MFLRRFGVLALACAACRGGGDAPARSAAQRARSADVTALSDRRSLGPDSSRDSAVASPSAPIAALAPVQAATIALPPGGTSSSAAVAASSVGAARAASKPQLPSSWPAIPAASARSPWCVDGLATLDEHSCYILPAVPTRTLLIYLHGIVPPRDDSPEKRKVQTVILNAVQRAGVVALVPRGRPGFGPAGRREWVGWPTTDALYEKYAAELVAEFTAEQKKLELLTGVTFGPVYLAGSSSGAYFVARLALHGGIDVDGFGAMSGGTGAEAMELARLAPKPFYIGYGKFDDYVRRAIPGLVDVLRRAHWPLRVAEHPVDHGAREVYLEEAFAFWGQQGH